MPEKIEGGVTGGVDELYREVILDHFKSPKNKGKVISPNAQAEGVNPLCGDDYHLYLKVHGGNIQEIGFKGSGCAISKSSASIMSTLIKGKSVEQAKNLRNAFLDMMTQDSFPQSRKEEVGKMMIFEGVKEFPVRVKCATLIWHALADALKDAD